MHGYLSAETTGGYKGVAWEGAGTTGKRFSRYLGHIVSSRVERDVFRAPRTNEGSAEQKRENPMYSSV